DRMTERERYRSRAMYYPRTRNWGKCVEEYGALVKQYPADLAGHINVNYCYENLNNLPKVVEELQHSLEILPQNQPSRANLALSLSYMGDFSVSERESRKVWQGNPSYEKAYRGLAYAQVGQGQIAEAIKTYQQLEKVSNVGESSAASGMADIALYEGRLGDALQLLQRGAAVDLKAGRTDSAAADLALL